MTTKENASAAKAAQTQHKYNFNSGPAILPKEVFEEAAQAVVDFNGSGLSILEIGHRTKLFGAVLEEATATLKELMTLDADHEVLFLHGGASTQFFQVPMNLLNEDATAAYTDTGIWGAKAIKEAKLFGNVDVVCSSKEANYTYLPKNFSLDKNKHAYVHITSNETVYGTQWHNLSPFFDSGVPVVADMSSDILSRQLPFNKFALIYAGAQKNIGAAGVNVVIASKQILGKVKRALPSMMDYRAHVDASSLLNTPPVFAVYVCMLTLRWLKKFGGIAAAEALNQQKAQLLYQTIDALPMFKGTVAKEDRSTMNACFVATDETLEKEFLALCDQEGMVGVKGYRTVGGFRASMYNAMPLEAVQALGDLMKHFAQTKG